MIVVTISGFGWFTAKSSAVATRATPAQLENLPTTLVLSDSQIASLQVETLSTARFRMEKDCVGSIDLDKDSRYLHDVGFRTLPNGKVIGSLPLSSLMPA